MLTEIIDLPSKGNLYPTDHPLSTGQVEIKYMTAREEDILTTQSFIENDLVIDKLLESVIVSEGVDPLDMTIGDREKVLLQTRILGYGPEYTFKYNGKEHTVNLNDLQERGRPDLFENSPYIDFTLPVLNKKVTLKVLSARDTQIIREELEARKKVKSNAGLVTIRLAHVIKAIDGDEDTAKIRELASDMPARDSLSLRTYLNTVTPDVDLTAQIGGEEVRIPIGINFLYPTANV